MSAAVLSAAVLVATTPAENFPFGYIIGGIMVAFGLGGIVYGQVLRRRGRRQPPRE